jgi:pilus assembly protein Flp/PilA
MSVLKKLKQLWSDKKGVTMLEYALIAALIAVAAVTILTTLGGTVSGVFSTINDKMSGA